MLLHLITAKQLKKKPKGMGPDELVIVTETDVIAKATATGISAVNFSGVSQMTFELPNVGKEASSATIPTKVNCPKVNYPKLKSALVSKFKNIEPILSVLRNAHSLTIHHLEKQLNLERYDAKALIDMLVKNGAYIKYYTYWRRTASFSELLDERKDERR